MMKKTIVVLAGMLLLLMPAVIAENSDIAVSDHSVVIEGTSVEEHLSLSNTGDQNCTGLSFWVMQDVQSVEILFEGVSVEFFVEGNLRVVNLSTENLSFEPTDSASVVLSYELPSGADSFEKRFQFPTQSYEVQYNGRTLCFGESLVAGQMIDIQLSTLTPATSDSTYLIIIASLIVLLVILVVLLLRKRKTVERREVESESKEVLKTKKELLVSLLKDLEKKHRAQDISDTTYSKVKSIFKQQAVNVMKKLDESEKN